MEPDFHVDLVGREVGGLGYMQPRYFVPRNHLRYFGLEEELLLQGAALVLHLEVGDLRGDGRTCDRPRVSLYSR